MRRERQTAEQTNTDERKTYTLQIDGRLPGLNEYISTERSNKYKAAAMKRESQMLVCAYIAKNLRGTHIRRRVRLDFLWVERDRRRDPSNIAGFGVKVIEDALVQQHVLQDDGWDEISGMAHAYAIDRKHPRIIVTITETD